MSSPLGFRMARSNVRLHSLGLFDIGGVAYFVWAFTPRLLLDSRVVDVLMAYTPTFVILSSLKSLSFNSLKNES
jgi:hypothetical protein